MTRIPLLRWIYLTLNHNDIHTMKKITPLILILLSTCFIRVSIAQPFIIEVQSQASIKTEDILPHERFRIPIEVNIPDLNSRSSLVQLQIPELAIQDFEIIRVSEFIEGIISLSARAIDGSERFVTLNWNSEGLMFGNISDFHSKKHFHIRHNPNERTHYLSEIIQTELDVLECSGYEQHSHQHEMNALTLPRFEAGSAVQSPKSENIRFKGYERFQASASGSTVIDVLLVYTPNAENWANIPTSGGMNFIVSEMMNLSQMALDNSQIPVLLRVAALRPISYSEDGVNNTVGSANHLRRLTASNEFNPWGGSAAGFMLEVHEMRKQYGADMVSALMEVNDVGGIAWLGTSAAPNPDLMFSVNRIQQMATTYTFVHELGHNWGLGHSRNQSASAAGIFGGAFQYSTGWRFTGAQDGQSYATVMTYGEGSLRIPHFSNPSVSFQGTPTGSYATNSIFAPADAALNIKNTAPYVAGILPTKVNAPAAVFDDSPINIVLEPGATAQHTLTITNSGDSRLFVRPELSMVSSATQSLTPPNYDWFDRYVNTNATQFPGIGASSLWGSSFDSNLDFLLGEFSVMNDWSVASRNQINRFEIRETATGDQALVLKYQANQAANSFLGVRSAYNGYFQNGGYEFTANVMISNPDQSTYYINLLDPTITYEFQDFAWLIFDPSGLIWYVKEIDSSGNWVMETSDVLWVPNEMKTVQMIYQPEFNAIHYYYDGNYITSTHPLSARKPLNVIFYRSNSGTTSEMIVDSAFLNPLYDGLGFIQASPERSMVQPGLNVSLNLSFDASNLTSGTYDAQLELITNDPANPVAIIPIFLTVTGDVSAPAYELPSTLSLEQNYPNPFNPFTTIQFSIPEASDVKLELFNSAGQRVLTVKEAFLSAGTHRVSVDASALSSGVYLYRLTTPSGIITRKMTLLK